MTSRLNTIEEAIEAFKKGEIVIVMDDEDRENEGDFICAAEKTTPEHVNFMLKHGRGQTCVPLLPQAGEGARHFIKKRIRVAFFVTKKDFL